MITSSPKLLLSTLATLLILGTVHAEDPAVEGTHKLECRYTKGETLVISLHSIIDKGTRCEAKAEGFIKIDSVSEKWADGKLTLTKLYVIKEKSGNGSSSDKDKLEDNVIDVRLFFNGKIIPKSVDLEKLEKKLEDFLEDLALAQHFQKLFFPLPNKKIALNKEMKMPLDGLLYKVKASEKGDLITLSGKPTSKDVNDKVKGELELIYNSKTKKIVSVTQNQSFRSVREGIVNSVTKNDVTRKLTIEVKKD